MKVECIGVQTWIKHHRALEHLAKLHRRLTPITPISVELGVPITVLPSDFEGEFNVPHFRLWAEVGAVGNLRYRVKVKHAAPIRHFILREEWHCDNLKARLARVLVQLESVNTWFKKVKRHSRKKSVPVLRPNLCDEKEVAYSPSDSLPAISHIPLLRIVTK